MANQLVIYLKDINTLSADWVFTQQNGELATVVDSGTISELTEKNKHAISDTSHVICIIKSGLIHYSLIDIPAKSKQRALQAIPFALEDILADDIELMHFATTKPVQNIYPVISIKHETLKLILQNLEMAGLKPDQIYPDILCLPKPDNNWNIFQHGNDISLHLTNGDLIHADNDSLPMILKSLNQQTAEQLPDCVKLWTDENSDLPDTNFLNETATESVLYSNSPLSLFCNNLQKTQAVNLLQGSYQVVNQSKQWWKPWKLAASLAAAVIILELITGSITLHRLESRNANIDSEIIKLYKKSFPGSKKIINARVQMENKLKKLRKSNGKTDYSFTDILNDIAPILQRSASTTIQGINFHNQKMEIQLILDKLSAAEELKKQLNALKNIKAELLSASSEGKQVNARIKLEAI